MTAKVVNTAAEAERLASLAYHIDAGYTAFGVTIGSTVVTTDINSSTSNQPTTVIALDANKVYLNKLLQLQLQELLLQMLH